MFAAQSCKSRAVLTTKTTWRLMIFYLPAQGVRRDRFDRRLFNKRIRVNHFFFFFIRLVKSSSTRLFTTVVRPAVVWFITVRYKYIIIYKPTIRCLANEILLNGLPVLWTPTMPNGNEFWYFQGTRWWIYGALKYLGCSKLDSVTRRPKFRRIRKLWKLVRKLCIEQIIRQGPERLKPPSS